MSKQARVEEELVVHRDVEERTETDSDTVRKEVDIEDGVDGRGNGTRSTDRSR
jgi:stress response protein YsnF